jgi:hypothetical protein
MRLYIQTRTIVDRKRFPWFNNDIKEAIKARRKEIALLEIGT